MLQREALELALYTFRYLPDAEGVVTLLPPPPPGGERAATATPHPGGRGDTGPRRTPTATRRADGHVPNAIFYRPGDLKPQLQVPLGVTRAGAGADGGHARPDRGDRRSTR